MLYGKKGGCLRRPSLFTTTVRLFSHALKGLTVFLLIHELTGISVALHLVIVRCLDLGAILDRANAVTFAMTTSR